LGLPASPETDLESLADFISFAQSPFGEAWQAALNVSRIL